MAELYQSASFLHVLFLTFILGCGCAWLAGRAIALSWRPPWIAIGATLLMGFALRFLHFALFEEPLIDPLTWLFETTCLLIVALISWRYARASQMVRQYYWLYEPAGPLGWRLRQNVTGESNRAVEDCR